MKRVEFSSQEVVKGFVTGREVMAVMEHNSSIFVPNPFELQTPKLDSDG